MSANKKPGAEKYHISLAGSCFLSECPTCGLPAGGSTYFTCPLPNYHEKTPSGKKRLRRRNYLMKKQLQLALTATDDSLCNCQPETLHCSFQNDSCPRQPRSPPSPSYPSGNFLVPADILPHPLELRMGEIRGAYKFVLLMLFGQIDANIR